MGIFYSLFDFQLEQCLTKMHPSHTTQWGRGAVYTGKMWDTCLPYSVYPVFKEVNYFCHQLDCKNNITTQIITKSQMWTVNESSTWNSLSPLNSCLIFGMLLRLAAEPPSSVLIVIGICLLCRTEVLGLPRIACSVCGISSFHRSPGFWYLKQWPGTYGDWMSLCS